MRVADALLGGTAHTLPDDLRATLAADAAASGLRQGLTPLGRNEFICWVEDAKQPATRVRRIVRTLEEWPKASAARAVGWAACTGPTRLPAHGSRRCWWRVSGERDRQLVNRIQAVGLALPDPVFTTKSISRCRILSAPTIPKAVIPNGASRCTVKNGKTTHDGVSPPSRFPESASTKNIASKQTHMPRKKRRETGAPNLPSKRVELPAATSRPLRRGAILVPNIPPRHSSDNVSALTRPTTFSK
jgi:hypothetical protein